MNEIIEKYVLVILDVDGTLVTTKSGETFRKSADDWQWLPGRVEKLRELKAAGVITALATNQGGVAYGFLQEDEITAEIDKVALETGGYRAICFTHPKASIEQYRREDVRRKPGPGMLEEIMRWYQVGSGKPQTLSNVIINKSDVLFVGDRYEDMDAAKAAGVDFLSAIRFFGDEIDPTRDYAREGTVVYPGYVSPYEFQRDEKHF